MPVTAVATCQDCKVSHSSQDGACGPVGLSWRGAHLLDSWQLCMGQPCGLLGNWKGDKHEISSNPNSVFLYRWLLLSSLTKKTNQAPFNPPVITTGIKREA